MRHAVPDAGWQAGRGDFRRWPVIGTYLHGIFADDGFRRAFLDWLAARRGRSGAFGEVDFDSRVDETLDKLAAHMAANLDLDSFARIAGL